MNDRDWRTLATTAAMHGDKVAGFLLWVVLQGNDPWNSILAPSEREALADFFVALGEHVRPAK